ncbi:MAG: hypothetical protein CMI56_02180 [Parcubacteria group bacterium]|nr:hypothetical protein [Parcubacteria group bacterium]|tara:strand:- start:2812 stop:3684 length:873 start_codon:yes stop_codon:yes gene_type:complete
MVTTKHTVAATIVAFGIGFVTVIAPVTATATVLSEPACVLNTIVQPFNNGGTTLSWKVSDAYTVHISGIGIVPDADSVVVYPTKPTTYTLTATGNAGVDTCTVVAQPTTSYSFNNNNLFGGQLNQTCSVWVDPDLVVPGGTAILSWDAGNASYVSIDNGVGNVGSTGSRVVPNTGVAQTYTLNARWANGTTRNCSATVYPTGSGSIGGTPYGGYGAAYPARTTQPNITYVSLNQVPYTGAGDVAYTITLLAVSIGVFSLVYTQRRTLASALLSFSPTDNKDGKVAVEHEA